MSDLNTNVELDDKTSAFMQKLAAHQMALDILADSALQRVADNAFAFKRLLIEFKAAGLVSDEDSLKDAIERFNNNGFDEPDRLQFRNNLADYETTMRALEAHDLI